MENEEKNPYLFYFIIALIVLGFIASLAFPLNAQEHKLRDASDAGDFPVPNLGFNTDMRIQTAPQEGAGGTVCCQRLSHVAAVQRSEEPTVG
jgi:hypothetical protein